MSDHTPSVIADTPHVDESLVTYTNVMYALHSVAVLIGLAGVAFGYSRADAAAAIIVAIFICIAGWRLGRRTIDTLTDTAPAGVSERNRRKAHAWRAWHRGVDSRRACRRFRCGGGASGQAVRRSGRL